jgi:tetrahydromethanopterin S-methyltransferase subunit E
MSAHMSCKHLLESTLAQTMRWHAATTEAAASEPALNELTTTAASTEVDALAEAVVAVIALAHLQLPSIETACVHKTYVLTVTSVL